MNKGFYSISKSKKYEAPTSASYAITASYIDPNFISASAAAAGFGGAGNIDTGSFATTGSNTFYDSQTIVGNITFPSSSFISTTNVSGGLYLSALNQGTLQLNADGGEGDVIIGRSGWEGSLKVIGNQTITGSIIFNSGSQITSTYYGNAYPGYIDIIAGAPDGFVELLSYNASSSFYIDDYGAYITTNSSSLINLWQFRNDGRLQAPRGIEAPSFTGSFSGSVVGYVPNIATGSFIINSQTSSFVQNTQTSSFANKNVTNTFTEKQYISSSLNPTNFTDTNAAIYTDGGLRVTQDAYISGTLYTNHLTVIGTASLLNITSSQLNIQTNLITVNTSTPAVRFGGLAVIDSGSTATGLTGSLLWDSQNDVWIYTNPSGGLYDGALLLAGPRSTGMGNEVGINTGYAAVGDGSHHMTSSAIYSSGSLIRLEKNTQITGSLNVSAGITGSLQGTASWASNYIESDPIFTSKSGSFATTASFNSFTSSINVFTQSINSWTSSVVLNTQTGSFVTNSQTSSFVTNSQTSSFVTNSQTSSFVTNSQTSSFVTNSQTGSMLSPYTLNSQTSSFVQNSQTSSFVTNSQTSSFVTNSQTGSMSVATASFAQTASFALNASAGGISQGKVVAIVTGMANLF
jgi:hypothetical protein